MRLRAKRTALETRCRVELFAQHQPLRICGVPVSGRFHAPGDMAQSMRRWPTEHSYLLPTAAMGSSASELFRTLVDLLAQSRSPLSRGHQDQLPHWWNAPVALTTLQEVQGLYQPLLDSYMVGEEAPSAPPFGRGGSATAPCVAINRYCGLLIEALGRLPAGVEKVMLRSDTAGTTGVAPQPARRVETSGSG